MYVMGYRVAPDCGDQYSDYKIRSCPIAGANKLASIIEAYQRHKIGIMPISSVYKNPTCAIVESLEILHYNSEEAQHRASERTMREAIK